MQEQLKSQNEEQQEWQESKKQFKKCLWPDDNYPGKLIKIEEFTGKFGPMKRLIFSCINPDIPEEFELAYSVSQKVTPDNKAGKALQALGVVPPNKFKWSEQVGKTCRVTVKQTSLKDKQGVGYVASVITDLLKDKSFK